MRVTDKYVVYPDADHEKLQELENLEEELGIDLLKLAKCKYVYIRKGKKIRKVSVLISLRGKYLLYFISPLFVKKLPFKKYGKTWALTKEELK